MTSPLFSVVIPTHNRLEFVSCAVESALQQHGCTLEIVVVDDGSTDDTVETLQARFCNSRVRYVRQEQQGATAARNHGADVACGRYLVFLDSDDELLPGGLEAFASAAEPERPAVVSAAADQVGPNGVLRRTRRPRRLGPAYHDVTGLFLAGTFAVRRDVFQDVGGFSIECRSSQHKEFALRLVPHCVRSGLAIAAIDQVTVRIHEHGDAHLRSSLPALLQGAVYIIDTHEQQLRQSPRHFADWCSIAAVYAARLGELQTARRLLRRAVAACPNRPANLARLAAACLPPLARRVWRQ